MFLSISVTEALKTTNVGEEFSINTCKKPDMLPTPRISRFKRTSVTTVMAANLYALELQDYPLLISRSIRFTTIELFLTLMATTGSFWSQKFKKIVFTIPMLNNLNHVHKIYLVF